MGINNENSNDIQYLISTRMISREYQVNRFMTRWGQNLQCPPGGRELTNGIVDPISTLFLPEFIPDRRTGPYQERKYPVPAGLHYYRFCEVFHHSHVLIINNVMEDLGDHKGVIMQGSNHTQSSSLAGSGEIP